MWVESRKFSLMVIVCYHQTMAALLLTLDFVTMFLKYGKTRIVLSQFNLEIYHLVDVMYGIKKEKNLADKLDIFLLNKKKKQ